MTEDEARTKWCPMSIVAGREGNRVGDGISGDIHYASMCIASDCMMWRWDWDLKKTDVRDPEDGNLPSGGYCGLANKP